MNTLIIYQSIHHGNTEKIAKKMAEVLGADLKRPDEVKPDDLANYDLIGFGSGIYMWKFHQSMLKFIDSLPSMPGKKAFTFFTCGAPFTFIYGKAESWKLGAKGFSLVGRFGCQGLDTYGPFKLIGGTGHGRPNDKDLAKAAAFAETLK